MAKRLAKIQWTTPNGMLGVAETGWGRAVIARHSTGFTWSFRNDAGAYVTGIAASIADAKRQAEQYLR